MRHARGPAAQHHDATPQHHDATPQVTICCRRSGANDKEAA
ncbi:hypothetical protein ACIGJO_19940 [Streptomyces sp. NPDC079020]